MRVRVLVAIVCIAAAAACSGGTPAPAGWQPVQGATGQWTTGAGAIQQRYGYEKRPFDGTLQALASQQAIEIAQSVHGAKFVNSEVFQTCPGIAAMATFSLPGARTLDEGLSVRGNQAILVRYERPNGMPADQGVAAAMQRALCTSSF